jgi:hypothetical protein
MMFWLIVLNKMYKSIVISGVVFTTKNTKENR